MKLISILLLALLSSNATATDGFQHSPELFELIAEYFPEKEIVFSKDIGLPSFNDREAYKYGSPNRLDHYNATYPFVLKTSIRNINKFSIFIIPDWDGNSGTSRSHAYKVIQREAFSIEGENIEQLNLKTHIQFSARSVVYFIAIVDEKAYINFKSSSFNKSSVEKLVAATDKEPVNHIVKWNKSGIKSTIFEQASMSVRGKYRDQVIKLRFKPGRSDHGYHYRSSYYSYDYEKPIASYIEQVDILVNQKRKYVVKFGAYSSTEFGGHFRLALDIPYTASGFPVIDVSWRDNHGFEYKKTPMTFDGEALKKSDVEILNSGAELYLPIKSGDLSKVNQLLEAGSDPNLTYPNGLTPVALALAGRKNKILETLISYGADTNKTFLHGLTPLMWVVASSNLTAIELLMQAGASPVTADDEGLTAFDRVFYFYKKRGYKEPHQTQANKREIVRLLTLHSQYFEDVSFLRLLRKTIEYDYYDLMRDYVDAGIPPNLGQGIMLRYFVEGLIFDYAETLIKRGANIDIVDKQGKTIFDHVSNKLAKCTNPDTYVYSTSYCVMLEEEFAQIKRLLRK